MKETRLSKVNSKSEEIKKNPQDYFRKARVEAMAAAQRQIAFENRKNEPDVTRRNK